MERQPQLYEDVWGELLDLSRQARYYHALARVYSKWDRVLRFIMLVSGTASVAVFLGLFKSEAHAAFGVVLACVVAADLVWSPGKKAIICGQASLRYNTLLDDYRHFWRGLSSLGHDEAVARLQAFQRDRDVILASISIPGAGNEALNERCAKEAYEVEGRQYAAA